MGCRPHFTDEFRKSLRRAGATGLVKCMSNPAAFARARSSFAPHPETATMVQGASAVSLAQPARDFIARHPRHADIEEDKLRPELLGQRQRLRAVVGDAQVVAMHLEQRGQGHCRIDVVVRDQDAQGALPSWPPRRRWRAPASAAAAGEVERQPDDEGAALAGTGADGPHRALVQVDQLAHQRQPDAEPALGVVHVASDLAEHVEHRFQRFGGNADAAVGHRDDGVVAVLLDGEFDACRPAACISPHWSAGCPPPGRCAPHRR